jgi:hypothetical protein
MYTQRFCDVHIQRIIEFRPPMQAVICVFASTVLLVHIMDRPRIHAISQPRQPGARSVVAARLKEQFTQHIPVGHKPSSDASLPFARQKVANSVANNNIPFLPCDEDKSCELDTLAQAEEEMVPHFQGLHLPDTSAGPPAMRSSLTATPSLQHAASVPVSRTHHATFISTEAVESSHERTINVGATKFGKVYADFEPHRENLHKLPAEQLSQDEGKLAKSRVAIPSALDTSQALIGSALYMTPPISPQYEVDLLSVPQSASMVEPPSLTTKISHIPQQNMFPMLATTSTPAPQPPPLGEKDVHVKGIASLQHHSPPRAFKQPGKQNAGEGAGHGSNDKPWAQVVAPLGTSTSTRASTANAGDLGKPVHIVPLHDAHVGSANRLGHELVVHLGQAELSSSGSQFTGTHDVPAAAEKVPATSARAVEGTLTYGARSRMNVSDNITRTNRGAWGNSGSAKRNSKRESNSIQENNEFLLNEGAMKSNGRNRSRGIQEPVDSEYPTPVTHSHSRVHGRVKAMSHPDHPDTSSSSSPRKVEMHSRSGAKPVDLNGCLAI